MTIKLDIGDPKSKRTFHVEVSGEGFLGKKIGETVKGAAIKEFNLGDFEFIITGFSHMTGIPGLKKYPGSNLKKVLLTRGPGMKAKKPQGLRMKKTIHGNNITDQIVQVNLKVSKGENLAKALGKEEKKEEKVEAAAETKKE